MTNDERIELLEEAQEELETAISKIEDALNGTSHESHANAYIIPHLRGWVTPRNPFNMSVECYIKELRNEAWMVEVEFHDGTLKHYGPLDRDDAEDFVDEMLARADVKSADVEEYDESLAERPSRFVATHEESQQEETQ